MKDESLSPTRIRPVIRHFLPLVDLLADFFGPHCEVVLHDFALPRGTIVKIRNGHLSGRRIGGPITDFGLQMIRRLREDPTAAVLQLNYTSHGHDGRELKSASMIIREKGRNVGALCLNLDLAPMEMLRDFLVEFCKTGGASGMGADTEEVFVPNFRSLMDELVEKAIKESRRVPGVMTRTDKLLVLRSLKKRGVFLMRGAVREVSARLGVATPTIYKYLNEDRNPGRGKSARSAGRGKNR